MLLSLHILLNYLSFPLKYGLSLGASQLNSGDNAAELLSAAALEYSTIWQTRKTMLHTFTTKVPEVITSVCCGGRQANKQTNGLVYSEQLGKGQTNIFAEYCAATPPTCVHFSM